MCVPLGHRNGSSSHRSIKTTISKPEVENIINLATYDICQWKPTGCDIYSDYEASTEDLVKILNDKATTVSVANTLKKGEYKRGYRTIIMVAPCVKATVLLRIKY